MVRIYFKGSHSLYTFKFRTMLLNVPASLSGNRSVRTCHFGHARIACIKSKPCSSGKIKITLSPFPFFQFGDSKRLGIILCP